MPSGWLTAELCTGPLCLTKVTSAMVKLAKRKRGQLLMFLICLFNIHVTPQRAVSVAVVSYETFKARMV
jgi:hypothetical protein